MGVDIQTLFIPHFDLMQRWVLRFKRGSLFPRCHKKWLVWVPRPIMALLVKRAEITQKNIISQHNLTLQNDLLSPRDRTLLDLSRADMDDDFISVFCCAVSCTCQKLKYWCSVFDFVRGFHRAVFCDVMPCSLVDDWCSCSSETSIVIFIFDILKIIQFLQKAIVVCSTHLRVRKLKPNYRFI